MITTCPYGFRVVGPATGERRLVDAGTAFTAYAGLDDRSQPDREAYLSAFQFGDDFRQYLDDNGTTRGFDGSCWAPWLWFDVDRDSLDAALADARRLAAFVGERYQLDDALLVFFSGSKGFHVGLPTTLWHAEPSTAFNRVARRFAERIAEAAGVAIDTGVYDKVRLFRAPNSRHQKTGRHKRRLALDDFLALSLDAILNLSAMPAPFDIPAPEGPCEQAAADWTAAIDAAKRQAEVKAQRQADGTPRLNRSTLAFIRDGAEQGDRHRLLFSAAANLAEFGCVPALAHALLTGTGLDSGLSPADVRRQIDCGLGRVGTCPPTAHADKSSSPPEPPKPAPDLAGKLAALWEQPSTLSPAATRQADVKPDQAELPLLPMPAPSPTLGAKVFFHDERGRPCEPGAAMMWTWEGSPTWYKTAEYPIPGIPPREGGAT